MTNNSSCSHTLVGVTFKTKSGGKGLVIIFQKKNTKEILEVENYKLIKKQIGSRNGCESCFKLKVERERKSESITLSKADYNRLSCLLAGYDDNVSTKSAPTVSNIFKRIGEEIALNAKGIANRLGNAFSLQEFGKSMNNPEKTPVGPAVRGVNLAKKKSNLDEKFEKANTRGQKLGKDDATRRIKEGSKVVPQKMTKTKPINFEPFKNLVVRETKQSG